MQPDNEYRFRVNGVEVEGQVYLNQKELVRAIRMFGLEADTPEKIKVYGDLANVIEEWKVVS